MCYDRWNYQKMVAIHEQSQVSHLRWVGPFYFGIPEERELFLVFSNWLALWDLPHPQQLNSKLGAPSNGQKSSATEVDIEETNIWIFEVTKNSDWNMIEHKNGIWLHVLRYNGVWTSTVPTYDLWGSQVPTVGFEANNMVIFTKHRVLSQVWSSTTIMTLSDGLVDCRWNHGEFYFPWIMQNWTKSQRHPQSVLCVQTKTENLGMTPMQEGVEFQPVQYWFALIPLKN